MGLVSLLGFARGIRSGVFGLSCVAMWALVLARACPGCAALIQAPWSGDVRGCGGSSACRTTGSFDFGPAGLRSGRTDECGGGIGAGCRRRSWQRRGRRCRSWRVDALAIGGPCSCAAALGLMESGAAGAAPSKSGVDAVVEGVVAGHGLRSPTRRLLPGCGGFNTCAIHVGLSARRWCSAVAELTGAISPVTLITATATLGSSTDSSTSLPQ